MGAIGAIGGALIGASSAKKAAASQERAANNDIAFQKETRDIIRNDLSTYREGGDLAQRALDFELGLGARPTFGGTAPQIEEVFGPSRRESYTSGFGSANEGDKQTQMRTTRGAPQFRVGDKTFATRQEAETYANANMTGGTEYGGFTKTPGYDFRLNQGTAALEAGAAARGGLYSGAAMRDLLKYGQDYGSNEYGNYLSRLGGRADTGLSAAGMSGQASQQAAAGVSNAYGNIGNAQAAGAIGVGNALNSGIQNLSGIWNYQKNLKAGA